MPRLIHTNPKYRKHRASGQAIVTIDAKDLYLGPHGSRASRDEYDKLISQWLAGGRALPKDNTDRFVASGRERLPKARRGLLPQTGRYTQQRVRQLLQRPHPPTATVRTHRSRELWPARP